MSHSSVERVIIPDSFLLIHYMLVKMREITVGLVIHREKIAENLDKTHGAIYSQVLLVELIERGMARSAAHEAIKAASQRAIDAQIALVDALKDDPQVALHLEGGGIDEESLLERVRATSRRLIERATT
jgi:adenylosuccinate lyase